MMNSSKLTQISTLKRSNHWPDDTSNDANYKMPLPAALKVFQFVLKGARLLPGLTEFIGYKMYFRIASKARTNRPSELLSLGAKEQVVTLTPLSGKASKRIRCYSLGNEADPTVVLIHGWESRAERMQGIAQQLISKGYRVVTFDSPAHGRSDGTSTDLMEINAIVKALLNGDSSTRAADASETTAVACEAIVAHSFGGVCATKLLADGLDCRSLVLVSTPATFDGVFEKFSYLLDLGWRTQARLKNKINARFSPIIQNVWKHFCTQQNIQKINQNVLIVHDLEDNIVPIEEAKKLFEAAEQRAGYCYQQVCLTSGQGHNRILAQNSLATEIASFIDTRRSQELSQMNKPANTVGAQL